MACFLLEQEAHMTEERSLKNHIWGYIQTLERIYVVPTGQNLPYTAIWLQSLVFSRQIWAQTRQKVSQFTKLGPDMSDICTKWMISINGGINFHGCCGNCLNKRFTFIPKLQHDLKICTGFPCICRPCQPRDFLVISHPGWRFAVNKKLRWKGQSGIF